MNKIAALGPMGTYGHQAAVLAQEVLKTRGISVPEILFQPRNEDILAVTTIMGVQGCFGVAPIENARGGLVREVVDHWLLESKLSYRSPLVVIGEIHLPIQHCLLAHPSVTNVGDVSQVMSHSQALTQCAGRLNALGFDSSRQVVSKSTAEAAEKVASGPEMVKTAAIASAFAAEFYGLNILEQGLEQQFGNETRFHILGTTTVEPTEHDRTAIVFHLPNKLGVLDNVIHSISEEGVNMSSIHSIPLGSMNEYAFYIEIDCHMSSDRGRVIKKKIELHTINPLILGSYPREKKEV